MAFDPMKAYFEMSLKTFRWVPPSYPIKTPETLEYERKLDEDNENDKIVAIGDFAYRCFPIEVSKPSSGNKSGTGDGSDYIATQLIYVLIGSADDVPVGTPHLPKSRFDPGDNAAVGEIAGIQWVTTANGKPPSNSNKADVAIYSVSGLSIELDPYLQSELEGDREEYYRHIVSIHDGDVELLGGKGNDLALEIGEGGKATVKGNKGNDTLWVWHEKTIDYDGGDGKDAIRFEYQVGFDPQPAAGAVIDLTAGTGVNPHGGQITLKNVENVIGQFGASNDLRGDDNANYLQSGTLADTLLGMGGNDSIYVKYNANGGARATHADGGVGTDTLTAELTYMEPFIGSGFDQKSINTLDLTNPANNTATFKGGTFENFEVFKAVQDFNTLFYFIGSDGGEKVYGSGYEDDFDGGGGNDLLAGGFAADELTGGAGADKFWFRYATDSNAAGRDTITDLSHAEHDRIDLSKIFGGKLDFLGSKNFSGHAGEVRVSSNGGDTLVEADTSGDKIADFALLLDGGPTVVAADLVL